MARRKGILAVMSQIAREAERDRQRQVKENQRQYLANLKIEEQKRKIREKERVQLEKNRLKAEITSAMEFAKLETIKAVEFREELKSLINTIYLDSEKINFKSLYNSFEFMDSRPQKEIYKTVPKKPKLQLSFLEEKIKLLKNKKRKKHILRLEEWRKNKYSENAKNKEFEKEYKKKILKWEEDKRQFYFEKDEYNEQIKKYEHSYNEGLQDGVEYFIEFLLENVEFPFENSNIFDLDYCKEEKSLIINYFLPNKDVIPTLKTMKFIQSRKEYTESHISEKQINEIYNEMLYSIPLKLIEFMYINETKNNVCSIAFNGWINKIDEGTGNAVNFCLLSIEVSKEVFLNLNLEAVKPKECFKKLEGISGIDLGNLIPIIPIAMADKDIMVGAYL